MQKKLKKPKKEKIENEKKDKNVNDVVKHKKPKDFNEA